MHIIKVISVDDHKIVRDGIRAMLMSNKEIKLIGEASGKEELFCLLEKSMPDLLLLDIAMPGTSGIEITKELSQTYPNIKTLILSANKDEESILNSVQAGAHGFLHKDSSKHELISAIKAVYNDEGYFSENLSKIIYNSYIKKVKEPAKKDKEPCLSERETDIIKLLGEGISYKEIADKLNISPRTVETHKSNILAKLNLNNTIELVKYAIKEGIIEL